MSDNPFALENIKPTTATPEANPFSLEAIAQDQKQDLRNVLQVAAQGDPQRASRAHQLSKRYGVGQDAVLQEFDTVSRKFVADNAEEKLAVMPALADYLRKNPTVASQTVDDVAPFQTINRLLVGGAYAVGTGITAGSVAGLLEQKAAVLDVLSGVTTGVLPVDVFGQLSAIDRREAKRIKESIEYFRPQAQSRTESAAMSGLSSAGQMLRYSAARVVPDGVCHRRICGAFRGCGASSPRWRRSLQRLQGAGRE